MSTARASAPTLNKIAAYWSEAQDFGEMFPCASQHVIGWTEPCCFRCGWLAPVSAAIECEQADWNAARGWLERCHLQDHALGGSMDPSNLVLMCALCHLEQPESHTREQGIAFVNSLPLHRRKLAPFVQVYTDTRYRGRTITHFKDALRLMERAYADIGSLYVSLGAPA